jgi:tetratricopeptide (TPR) repeat protein
VAMKTADLSAIVAPALVLVLLASIAPVGLARGGSGASNDECLAIGERSAAHASPRSVALLEQCHQILPDDVEILAELGAAYEAIDPARAERAYERALTLDSRYADIRLQLARLMLRRGATADAARHAEIALQIQPNRQALRDVLAASRSSEEARP